MIRSRTLVVVGAGASNDLGLPIGSALQSQISDLLQSPNDETKLSLSYAMENYFKDPERGHLAFNRLKNLSKQLRTAASLDNFLDQHRDEPDVISAAKACIVYKLAEAEQNSAIADEVQSSAIVQKSIDKDYFALPLLNILSRGHTASDLLDSLSNIHFVIFNYDRCLEFIIDAWLNFRFSIEIPKDILRENFIHVYGAIYNYDREKVLEEFMPRVGMPFTNPKSEIPNHIDNIKIFTEQEDSKISNQIDNLVRSAQAIVFLGFGFEEQNMRFFQPNTIRGRSIFATTFGFSDENKSFIKHSLATKFTSNHERVWIVQGRSKKLFDDCYHPLTHAVGSL